MSTLSHIEQRVLELRDLLGVTDEDIASVKSSDDPKTADEELLSGPALKGEGINQGDVDALMGGAVAAPAPAATPEPAPAAAPAPKAEPKPKPAPKPEPKAEAPKPVNPKKLDAMFEEDFDPMADLKAKEEEEAKAKEKGTKAQGKEDELKNKGEEVSQDDIDALFG